MASKTRRTTPPAAPRTEPRPKPKGRGVFLAVLGAVAVLAVVAVVATSGSDGDGGSGGRNGDGAGALRQTGSVRISGDPLPQFDDDDDAVGMAAPRVTGTTFDGETIEIGGGTTGPQVVLFVAHWCPHCQREVPVITDWIDDEGMPDGVDLLAVSTGVQRNAPNYPPSEWLEEEGWPITTLADDESSSAAGAFGLTGYPFFVAIGGDGDVVARASGELTIDELESLIDAARAG